jgi:hypothetical protein
MSGINLTLLGSSSKETFWMATLGTTDIRIEGNNIAIDSAGNAHIAGFWEQGGVQKEEAYLYKIDKDGALQWQKQLGTSGTAQANSDVFYGIAVDSSGNCYAGGWTYQNDPTDQRNGLLAKYNSSGVLQFQTKVGTTSSANPYFKEIRVDSNNNVYAAGTYTDPTNGDSFATFKFNSSGTFQSMYNLFTSTGSEDSSSLAIDSSDNFYTTGTQYLPSGGDRYALLSKRNSSGTLQWQTRILGSSNEDMYGYACAVNASGNIVQVGERIGASSPYPAFIAYYDSTPTLQWSRTLVGTSTNAFDVALDSSNNSYLCGRNDNSGYQGFIAKYDGSGTIQFQRTITVSSRTTILNSIKLDAKGNIYVCGTIEPTSGSTYFAFVAKLPNDGSLTGTYTVGSLSITYAASSLTDASVSTTQTTPTLTNGTPSIAEATPTLTDASSTFTYTTTTI